MADQPWSRAKTYAFMGIMLLTGSINTIANKMQQDCKSMGKPYKVHQKFITFCMFIGMTLCLGFFHLQRLFTRIKVHNDSLQPQIPENTTPLTNEEDTRAVNSIEKEVKKEELQEPAYWLFFFPAFFDLLGSSIQTIGLSFVASSIYQMFRGAIVIFTTTFSIIFLKSKMHRHHFLGITIVIIGLVCVGISSMIKKAAVNVNAGLGIALIIIGQIFSAGTMVIEEKILKGYKILPLKACGSEGSWGAMTYVILLVIFYFIRCTKWPKTLKDNVCSKDSKGVLRFENAIQALKMLGHSWKLLCYALLYITSIAFFNFAGISVTKYVSATARTVVDACRTIIVWGFFLLPFNTKSTREHFHWLQLLGFLITICGGAIFNEIVELPFWGFNENTKRAIKKREEMKKEKEGQESNTLDTQ